ncbi:hypothetical protein AB4541_07380 [Vibrio sp. 10N.222.54.C1]
MPSSLSLVCGAVGIAFLVLAIINRKNSKMCWTFQALSILGLLGFIPFVWQYFEAFN